MKIYVGYDKRGKILAMAIPSDSPKDGELGLDPEPGRHAGHFDVEHADESRRHQLLSDLFHNHRVERTASGAKGLPARLVKKPPRKAPQARRSKP